MSGEAWYRHPWVWALFVPPVAAIVFWAVIITRFAGPPSLVVDDYAKIGLAYEQERSRDTAAAELGLSGRLHLERASGGATVVLRGLPSAPKRLELRLAHPTEASRDRRLRLSRTASGIYRGSIGGDLDGRWRVELTPPDGAWRLADVMFAGEADLELAPPDPVVQ